MKILVMMLLIAVAGFGQELQKPIQDPSQLIGKQVIVQRAALCQPATYTVVSAYAGKQAKVVSLKAASNIQIPQTVKDSLTPDRRAALEDAQKAAIILVQFGDGTQLDTCKAVRPSKLSDYFELAPGESLQPVAQDSTAQDKPSESTPPSDGVFYKNATGWQQLQVLAAAGQDVHVNMFTMHGGGNQVYRGAEAPIRLSDRRPVFYIKISPVDVSMAKYGGRNAARDTMIVILRKKKDNRELQSVKTGLTGVKSGIDKKSLPDITVRSVSDLLITATPNKDLPPGEYLLTWDSSGSVGYDFGIN
jgi:hypothetical protein